MTTAEQQRLEALKAAIQIAGMCKLGANLGNLHPTHITAPSAAEIVKSAAAIYEFLSDTAPNAAPKRSPIGQQAQASLQQTVVFPHGCTIRYGDGLADDNRLSLAGVVRVTGSDLTVVG
jgi:hypothetical protein